MEQLFNWSRQRGAYIHPALHIDTVNGVRGVFAKQAIPLGEALIILPKTAYLSPAAPPWSDHDVGSSQRVSGDENYRDEFEEFIKNHNSPISTFIQQVLRLLHEQGKGEKSQFFPYVSTLPQEFDMPMFWTDEEYKELKGMTIYEENRSVMEERFRQNVKPLMDERPDLFPPSTNSFARFRLASACVMSRGFHGSPGTGPYMLPVVDMLNHDPDQKCTTLNFVGGSFRMHAEREIASGIELFHSYGELGNSQLLHTYGFVLPSNPHDNVAVPLSVMADNYRRLRARRDKLGLHRYDDYEEVIEIVDDSEDEEIASESHGSLDSEDSSARRSQGESSGRLSLGHTPSKFVYKRKAPYNVKKRRKKQKAQNVDPMLQRKIQFLENYSIPEDFSEDGSAGRPPASNVGLGVMVISLSDPLPEEILTAAQILVMTGEEFEEFEQSPIPLGMDTMEEDFELAGAVWQLLLGTVDSLNAKYPSTVQEDEAALAKGGLTRRQTYAIQARMGEKLVVKALKRLVIVGMMRTSEEAESEEDSGFTGDEAEEDEVDE